MECIIIALKKHKKQNLSALTVWKYDNHLTLDF